MGIHDWGQHQVEFEGYLTTVMCEGLERHSGKWNDLVPRPHLIIKWIGAVTRLGGAGRAAAIGIMRIRIGADGTVIVRLRPDGVDDDIEVFRAYPTDQTEKEYRIEVYRPGFWIDRLDLLTERLIADAKHERFCAVDDQQWFKDDDDSLLAEKIKQDDSEV